MNKLEQYELELVKINEILYVPFNILPIYFEHSR